MRPVLVCIYIFHVPASSVPTPPTHPAATRVRHGYSLLLSASLPATHYTALSLSPLQPCDTVCPPSSHYHRARHPHRSTLRAVRRPAADRVGGGGGGGGSRPRPAGRGRQRLACCWLVPFWPLRRRCESSARTLSGAAGSSLQRRVQMGLTHGLALSTALCSVRGADTSQQQRPAARQEGSLLHCVQWGALWMVLVAAGSHPAAIGASWSHAHRVAGGARCSALDRRRGPT